MSSIKLDVKDIRVIDGDTFEGKVKFRLHRIDTMETKGIERAEGLKAKAWLENKLAPIDVLPVEIVANDRYFRAIAEAEIGGVNLSDEMIEEKVAEVYTPEHHNNGKLDV